MTMKERRYAQINRWKAANWVKNAIYIAICGAKKRSAKKNLPFEIEAGHMMKVLSDQGGVCALSGIEFRKTDVRGQKSSYSPSLDKIIPSLGYVPGNVRIILDGLNSLKAHGSDEDLLSICRAVVEYNK